MKEFITQTRFILLKHHKWSFLRSCITLYLAHARHIKFLFCDLPLRAAFFSRMTSDKVKVRVETTEKVSFDKKNTIASVTLGMKIYCMLEHNCLIRKAKRKSDWETVHPTHKRKIKFWSNQCDTISIFHQRNKWWETIN